MSTFRERHRLVCFAWSYLECLGFAGIIFGWSSLVYVLKDEGLYLDLCPNDTNSSALVNQLGLVEKTGEIAGNPQTCDARDARLALVFSIGSGVMGAGVCLVGIINLKVGTRVTRLILFAMFTTGALLIAFTSNETPWLIFPGLALQGIAGNTVFMTNVQVSFLFPVWGSVAVSMLSGAMDASCFTQLLVKIGHENGISRFMSYIIITCAHILTLVNTFFLLPRYFIQKPGEVKGESYHVDSKEIVLMREKDENVENPETMPCQTAGHQPENPGEQPKESTTPTITECILTPEYVLLWFWYSLLNLRFLFYLTSINSVLEDIFDTKEEAAGHQPENPGEQPKESTTPTITECILTPEYVLLWFWYSLLNLRFLFYLTSINSVFEDIFDTKEEVSGYTNAMMYTFMFGAVISVLPGYVFDSYVEYYRKSESILRRQLMPCVVPLSLTSLLAALLSMTVLFTGPITIYVQFAILVFLRSFLFSVLVANMRQLFPSQYLITLYGIQYFGGGVISFFQYALFVWTDSSGFQQVNIFSLVLTLVSFVYPGYLWRKCWLNDRNLGKK